jgi:hypothetical protein
LSTGLSTGSRVSSFTIAKMSRVGRPHASSAVHPVSRSASALRNVTRLSTSVTITPSPMLASVVASRSRDVASSASARLRSATSRTSPRRARCIDSIAATINALAATYATIGSGSSIANAYRGAKK